MSRFPRIAAVAAIAILACALAVAASAATHYVGSERRAEATPTRMAPATASATVPATTTAGSGASKVNPNVSRSGRPHRVASNPLFGDYRLPLSGRTELVAAFEPPATKYSAGHRGVDLAAVQGTGVLAAGDGVVRFAGYVAGRQLIVIQHPDGLSTEYEPVRPRVRVGQRVAAGQLIGAVQGDHQQSADGRCLHWGARRGETYIDPMSLLTQLGVVRLVE